MITKIQKWGNSQGVRFSREMLERAGIGVGDEVEIEAQNGSLVVTPCRRIRGAHDLRELVSKIPDGYRSGELDWGAPTGKENW